MEAKFCVSNIYYRISVDDTVAEEETFYHTFFEGTFYLRLPFLYSVFGKNLATSVTTHCKYDISMDLSMHYENSQKIKNE